jgi:hypothetical protein
MGRGDLDELTRRGIGLCQSPLVGMAMHRAQSEILMAGDAQSETWVSTGSALRGSIFFKRLHLG